MMWWDDTKVIKHKPLNKTDYHVILIFAKNDMKIQATADELERNYNCIAYRLSKINAITGLDPRKFYDLIKLVDMANSKLDGDGNA